jgi:alpha-L-fucosidase
MRTIAPNTPVFSDIGPDIRWVGNEKGIAGKTNWNLLDTAAFNRGAGAPSTDTLNSGNENGKNYIPAECDVSIRPGWFYHESENDKVKTPEQLFDLYLKSVGRGANLILNVPPDRRGLINEHDSAALVGFKKLRDENLSKNLLKGKTVKYTNGSKLNFTKALTDGSNKTIIKLSVNHNENDSSNITANFNKPTETNCIVLQEPVQSGQRIKSLTIFLMRNHQSIKDIQITTVGKKRIVTFPAEQIDSIVIKIEDAKAAPLLSEVAAYLINENLIEKNE